jgi:hypothetical protein
MPNIALPISLDFMNWARQIQQDLPSMNIPIPENEENWRQWAYQLINMNSISNFPIPTELSYPKKEDWRQWAIFFSNCILNQ